MHRCFVLAVLFPLVAFLPATAAAQPAATRDLALEIVKLHEAVGRLEEINRMAAHISYTESVALLSHAGDWPHEKRDWPGKSPFFYDVFKLKERLHPSLVHIRKYLERSTLFDEAGRAAFGEVIDSVETMIEDTRAFFDLLENDRLAEANAFYRERTREHLLSVERDTYTLALGLDDRIKKKRLEIRLAK